MEENRQAGGAEPSRPASLSADSDSPASLVFDPDEALRRCAGESDILADMANCFLGEADQLLDKIDAALRRWDVAEIERTAHRLKGTLVYLGADPAVREARVVERMQNIQTRAEAEAAVGRLIEQIMMLKDAITIHRGVA